MYPFLAKRSLSVIALTLLIGVGIAAAQPAHDGDPLPTRCFARFGATTLRHGSQILCLAYTPDGQTLVAGGGIDPVRFWNPKTGALIREINEPWVQAIAFSASGETVIFGSLQKNIRMWNFKLDKETGKLEGHKAAIKAIAVAPDTSIIASGSQDGAIYLWDWNTKRKVEELKGHTDEVTALVYTPDNNLLISAGSDRVILVWSAETNKSILKIDAGCGVQALAVSADSKTLYSAGDDYLIRRWDIATGKQTGVFKGHQGIVVSLILQGNSLISGALDDTIRIWDVKTTQPTYSLPRRHGDCNAIAVTNAGDFIATAGTNNTIRIFETVSGKETTTAQGPQAGLVALVPSPDRKRLAGATLSGQILVWDTLTGHLSMEWRTTQTGDFQLAWSPDGKTLVSAADTVRFWNPASGIEIAQLPAKGADSVVSLAYSPDGRMLAFALRSGDVDLWDVAAKKLVTLFKYGDSLHAVAWSPNGKFIAAGGAGKILIWDTQAGTRFKSFDVKEGPPPVFPQVASLVFGPDSRTLAAGCFDALIRIYNVHAKNPTTERDHPLCEGHLSMPCAIAFSPDGRTLVSGSFDRTVRLWEAFSGKQIAEFKGHIGAVMGVAFTADGRSVFSAGTEGTVLQWDVPGLLNNGKLPDVVMTPKDLENAWTMLSSEDTARGHETMWRSIASAAQAVPSLTKNLYLLDPEKVKKLFRDLDSVHYPTRIAAMEELSKYGRWMEGRYDEAIAGSPSLEYKRRVETLKERLTATNSPSLVQERLRTRRIMLICEQVGSPEAIAALKDLAERAPEEELQEEAKGSLRRLGKK
jgi:WD40 repeat protein